MDMEQLTENRKIMNPISVFCKTDSKGSKSVSHAPKRNKHGMKEFGNSNGESHGTHQTKYPWIFGLNI